MRNWNENRAEFAGARMTSPILMLFCYRLFIMENSQSRRKARIEALGEALDCLRQIQCPPDKSSVWTSEFDMAIDAASRVLANQLAQAEGRVHPRKTNQNQPR